MKPTAKPKPTAAEYTCAVCHETYEKGWSDDMAQAELGLNFGEQFVSDECEVVCDDCYKRMFEFPELIEH